MLCSGMFVFRSFRALVGLLEIDSNERGDDESTEPQGRCCE
jgi:hypothetical protein